MARLRFRFELKTGTEGVPLHKLANLAEDMQRFLRMVAEDVATEPLKHNWQAVNFYNGSVGFDIEHAGEADDDQARIYRRAVRHAVTYEPTRSADSHGLRKDTILQFAHVGENIEPTETINFGFFANGDKNPDEWRSLSKTSAVAITTALQQIVEYRGMVQGIVHSLYKESQPAYFDVRELSSKEIVKCIYPPEKYRQVVNLLLSKDAVVLVSGMVKARRLDRTIQEIRVEKMRAVEPLSDDEFKRLQGSAPRFTGDLSTDQFIGLVRRRNRNGDE